jgi:hypothetical protein
VPLVDHARHHDAASNICRRRSWSGAARHVIDGGGVLAVAAHVATQPWCRAIRLEESDDL